MCLQLGLQLYGPNNHTTVYNLHSVVCHFYSRPKIPPKHNGRISTVVSLQCNESQSDETKRNPSVIYYSCKAVYDSDDENILNLSVYSSLARKNVCIGSENNS